MQMAIEGFTFTVADGDELVRVSDEAGNFVDFFDYTTFVYGTSDSEKVAACQYWARQRAGLSPKRVSA